MKTTAFKNLIKEALREIVIEEIKPLLLESLNKNQPTFTSSENNNSFKSTSNLKNRYEEILNETALSLNNNNPTPFIIPYGVNTLAEGSSLPEGDVPLDLIGNLLNPK
jgi:hypothetical protein